MRRKTKLYLTLGVMLAVTAAFAAAVVTDSLSYPYACWLIGSDHLEKRPDGTFKTDRPEGADETMPIVIKTVDGVEGPYMDMGEKSEP